jgi:hypothetical protein
MATAVQQKSGFEKWKDDIAKAVGDARWDSHDCEIRVAVGEFNRHLNGVAGYSPLDWQIIKAMVWTESGAAHAEWHTKPMQIGVPGDPGLASFLSGKEGGDLILPAGWKGKLTVASVRTATNTEPLRQDPFQELAKTLLVR